MAAAILILATRFRVAWIGMAMSCQAPLLVGVKPISFGKTCESQNICEAITAEKTAKKVNDRKVFPIGIFSHLSAREIVLPWLASVGQDSLLRLFDSISLATMTDTQVPAPIQK